MTNSRRIISALRVSLKSNGSLTGIPMAVKDLYSETGVPTTAASKMLENYVAPYESTVTKRLKAAGMISSELCVMNLRWVALVKTLPSKSLQSMGYDSRPWWK